jgi:hypothetical protein
VEDILTKSKAFTLPGKKKLLLSDHEIEFIVVDVAETPKFFCSESISQV